MVGVSLITHFVTYPSFRLIKSNTFSEFHKSYTKKMLFIVAPVMILELISSLLLVIFDISDNHTEIGLLITLILIWLLTFFNIVPIHNKLTVNYNKDLNQKLIKLNGLRTILWILKLILFIGFCDNLAANFH
jgi:hypothetical protein|tara:strand:- start:97 stop:492 length:396 start_codon:yes stop_codon:yes gene_type:complete